MQVKIVKVSKLDIGKSYTVGFTGDLLEGYEKQEGDWYHKAAVLFNGGRGLRVFYRVKLVEVKE